MAFVSNVGMLQRDPTSPLVFSLDIANLEKTKKKKKKKKTTTKNKQLQINSGIPKLDKIPVTYLICGDDIVLLSKYESGLPHLPL